MEKISCNVIKDILPLYVDDVVCEETRKLVENHLCQCNACREELNCMAEDINISVPDICEQEELKALAKSVSNIEQRGILKYFSCAAFFDLLLNIGMPIFVMWVRSLYIAVNTIDKYIGMGKYMSLEMMENSWDFIAILGYCIFFGCWDVIYIVQALKKKSTNVSEAIVIMSYTLKIVAILAFILLSLWNFLNS